MLSGSCFFLPRAKVVRDQSHIVNSGVLEMLRDLLIPLSRRATIGSSATYCPMRPLWASLHGVRDGRDRGLIRLSEMRLPAGCCHLLPLGDIRCLVSHRGLTVGWRVKLLLSWLHDHICLIDRILSHSLPRVVICVEAWGGHAAAVKAHLFRFLQDALERVNQVVVIFIRFKDVEARQNKLVLFLDQLIQKLHVVCISKMIPSQWVHILKKLILLPGKRWLGSLYVCRKLRCEAGETEA